MMEKLSDLLRQYFDEKGINLSIFSDQNNISRSKLYRFLDGSSLPDVEELLRLCNALRLPNSERTRFANAYKASRLNGVARVRQHVENMIYELNVDREVMRRYSIHINESPDIVPQYRRTIESSEMLYKLLFQMLSTSTGCDILILSQLENKKLFTYIAHALSCENEVGTIQHGFRIRPGYERIENLTLYKHIIELCLINDKACTQYMPKYMYTSDLTNREMEIFPNIIVNNKMAILYTDDFEHGIVLCEEQHVAYMYQRTLHILERMENFVSVQEGTMEAAASFFDQFDLQQTNMKVYMVEPQPCLSLLSPNHYEGFIEDEKLLASVRLRHENLMHKLQKKNVEYHQFFTKDGIHAMLCNCRHVDIPAGYRERITSNDVFKQLIRKTIQLASKRQQVKLHLFNNNFLELSERSFVYSIYSGSSIVISTPINAIDQERRFMTLVIVEKGIVDAFSDYFDGLVKDSSILGEETPIASDEEAIVYLESVLENE